jgi:UDP-2,4-diacetamido-2,4,6-trideoxy-beta-L-altropyranose hydrolase
MQSINVIPDNVDLLIVDNYALDEVWHKQLRRYTTKIMVIDDLANRSFDCDLLLNQNIASRRRDYKGKVSSNCQLMLGCRYAMLRDEFSEAREKSLNKRKQTKLVKNILVSMGGGDVDNITYEILKHLNGEFDVTVVLGGASPHNSMVKSYAFNKNIRVVIDSKNMARLMFNADLAIGAGGSTSWERCCLGLPTLLFIMEENQRVVSEKIEEIGAAIVVRDFKHDLDRILNNPELWMLMSKKASLVCDGLGVKRIKI